MKHKHIPKRMCIVCREKFNKKELNRYVFRDSRFVLDKQQTMPGRGFYLCNKSGCRQLAEKKFQALESKIKSKRKGE